MNAKSGSGSSGTFVWGLVAGLVAVLGAGGLYLSGVFGTAPVEATSETEVAVQQPSEDAPSEEPAPAPAEDVMADATPETPDEQTAGASEPEASETAPETTAPVLDQIFVEPDGNTLLSGNAEPGADVNVVLDGETVHSFTVDESGQFAEFLSIPFADDARGLVLETPGQDEPVRSDDYLIAALPAPEPEPEEETPATVETPVAEAEIPAEETTGTESAAVETPQSDAPETETAAAEVPEETAEAPEEVAEAAEAETEEAPAETTEDQGQQVAILRSGEEGVELVQPPETSESPQDQVALDTIGYSDEGEVELTGRAQDESSVRLYLDNTLVADLDPSDDGQWRGEIEGVDPGVYTLRVDEVSPEGDVVSRIETPFKREPVETLRAAEAAANADATTGTPPIRSVTVQKGDTLWAISRERFGDGVLYVRLFEANREAIRDPDLIYPGQIFTIPE